MRDQTRARSTLALACLSAIGLSAGGTLAAPASAACPNEAIRQAQSATGLPECRAYEMVSPPDKSGLEVMIESKVTHASADGDAIAFDAIGGIGDAHGDFIQSNYVARRSTDPDPGDNGWATHGVTPTQLPASPSLLLGAYFPNYPDLYTPDLSRAVYQPWSPLIANPFTDNEPGALYLRSDLLTPGNGAYTMLSGCPYCEETNAPIPLLPRVGNAANLFELAALTYAAGASEDLGHVLFESKIKLTPEATAYDLETGTFQPQLYESEEGTVRLVGLVPPPGEARCGPGGPSCSPSPLSMAGLGATSKNYTPDVISADGSRVIFSTPKPSKTSFPGDLYERIGNGTPQAETIKLNASERSVEDTPKPAIYQDASRDGGRVFFTTEQKLTDAASGPRGLYMYDAEAPQGTRLTLIDDGAADVIGTGADGHYVYYLDGAHNVELWHDGQTTYVGTISVGATGGGAQGDRSESIWDSKDTINLNNSKLTRVSPDGRHLLLVSRGGGQLLSVRGGADYDQSGCPEGCRELYLYSADTDTLQCASCIPDGTPATGDATNKADIEDVVGGIQPGLNRGMSDDGRYVFFTTPERLAPEDTNGVEDAYVYDSVTGKPSLLSSGQDKYPSYYVENGAGGRDAFILTRQRLSGWDVDGGYDLYDVRIGGGFPEPPPPPPSCQGDACQSAPRQLNDPTPGTETVNGPGNAAPRKHRHARRHKKQRKHPGHAKHAAKQRRAQGRGR